MRVLCRSPEDMVQGYYWAMLPVNMAGNAGRVPIAVCIRRSSAVSDLPFRPRDVRVFLGGADTALSFLRCSYCFAFSIFFCRYSGDAAFSLARCWR
uniref:Uncharacterized protein n=1 Tax=Escherichia coli TaxID=562 RepID=A0A5P1MTI6_ECOLX|nr:hypothetical protein p13ZX36-90_00102 [Escherichia coli]